MLVHSMFRVLRIGVFVAFIAFYGIGFACCALAQTTAETISLASASTAQLPLDSEIPVVTTAALGSKFSKKGQAVYFVVLRDVSNGGEVIVPTGAKVSGKVVDVRSAGPFGRPGSITIAAESLAFPDGTVVPVKLVSIDKSTGRDRSSIAAAGGIVVGGIVGYSIGYASSWNDNALFSSHSSPVPTTNAIGAWIGSGLIVAGLTKGGDAKIPVGTQFTIVLTQKYTQNNH